MLSFVRKAAIGATFAAAALAATPANAADTVVDPCSATWVSGGIACVGYYGGNYFQGGVGTAVTDQDLKDAINLLLTGPATNSTPAYSPTYNLDTSKVLGSVSPLNSSATITFANILLNGLTVVGIHFGNTPDAGTAKNISALWLVDVKGPTNTLTLSDGKGSSNAQIFATQSAVPEPSTWALMLLGFGGMGVAMRRRRSQAALLQMA